MYLDVVNFIEQYRQSYGLTPECDRSWTYGAKKKIEQVNSD